MIPFLFTALLIGLLSAHQLVRAYYGPEIRPPAWHRWLAFAIFLNLVVFLVIIAMQVLSIIQSG